MKATPRAGATSLAFSGEVQTYTDIKTLLGGVNRLGLAGAVDVSQAA
ncbi:hypothetical protein [Rhodoferax sp.]|nr:hypothetical protein [Rhodoferax sp.]MDD2925851.1 hypothetical protein [Rhodoferax sp.]